MLKAASSEERQLRMKLNLMMMSGVEDGQQRNFDSENGDGHSENGEWIISIGRRDDNDITLRSDTFISRIHAQIHWKDDRWWLEDCASKNGTFIEGVGDEDVRVTGTIPITPGQLFRIGRTWMRIQVDESAT